MMVQYLIAFLTIPSIVPKANSNSNHSKGNQERSKTGGYLGVLMKTNSTDRKKKEGSANNLTPGQVS